jgi:hypothetical protein
MEKKSGKKSKKLTIRQHFEFTEFASKIEHLPREQQIKIFHHLNKNGVKYCETYSGIYFIDIPLKILNSLKSFLQRRQIKAKEK